MTTRMEAPPPISAEGSSLIQVSETVPKPAGVTEPQTSTGWMGVSCATPIHRYQSKEVFQRSRRYLFTRCVRVKVATASRDHVTHERQSSRVELNNKEKTTEQ